MTVRYRHPTAALLGVLAAAGMVSLTGAGDVIGGGGVATACAQVPTIPTEAIPTIGPVDPACSRVPDTDNDGVFDYEDNCHNAFNPSQRDTDGDSGEPPYEPVDTKTNPRDPMTGGDTCDVDDDGDRVNDIEDNCEKAANANQADADRDGIGDKCDDETSVPAASGDGGSRTPTAPSAGGGGGAAGGGPSTSGASTGGPAPVARPTLRVLRLARTVRVAELQTGLAVPVRCSAGCVVAGDLVADRRSARRLRVTRLGRGVARVDEAGMTFVFVRLSRKVLSRVRRARSAKATLRLTAFDLGGARRQTVSRRLTLKR